MRQHPATSNRKFSQPRSAFTLVEILIVVVILGILAAIVVPQFAGASQEATNSTLQTTLATIQARLDYEYHFGGTGAYPTIIDASWFASGKMPEHPENAFGVPAFEIVNSGGITHPLQKVLTTGIGGAFWYNRAEGIIRVRVGDRGSSAATLNAYNLINKSNESALGNYGGGFGS